MKYKLTDETREWFGRILHRIEAVTNFGNVKAGDKGGWIEKEENLAHDGDCCVYGDARVYGYASVCGKADIKSKGDIIWLTGIGSQNRTTTLFRTKEGGILVSCGCFSGDLAAFEAKVKETHGDSKYAREYLSLIETAKIHFEEES